MNSTSKEIVKPIVVLTCICLVVTALLAYINTVTQPIIQAAEEKAATEARAEVLPEANGSFTPLDIEVEGVTEAYQADNGAGYVFSLVTKGYGGDAKLICGINSNGEINSCKTLSHGETSGIGSRVFDNNEPFKDNFTGKTADTYEQVDGITGATISSTAYKKALKSAFEAYEAVKEAK